MAKKHSLKELVAMLKPNQIGLRDNLIYRPEYANTPQIRALRENSGWKEVKGTEDVLQAFPTLENFYALKDYGLEFSTTQKIDSWLEKSIPTLDSEEEDAKEDHVLFNYQREAAKFLLGRQRAMLSLSPGLGKTLTSAYAAGLNAYGSVLVVCPASLLYYWKGELEKWKDKLPLNPVIQIWHKKVGTHGDIEFDVGKDQVWIVTNPETVAKHLDALLEQDFGCLIVDESIMYKHRESQRSDAIKSLAQGIETTWLLTGAPATRYLDDFWHQFHILKPKGYASYWRFARKYCIVEDNEWGSKVVANRVDSEKEIKKNFSDIYFSRTQDNVANIPDWIMEDIDIPMHLAQDKAYETLRKELYIQVDSLDPNEKITVGNHLSLMIRSVQVASNPLLVGGVNSAGKWDSLPELMEIYPGPFIVWNEFIKTGELIRDNLAQQKVKWAFTADGKMRVALANGSTKMEDRNSMVNSFQNGELDVLILNTQVGKFGWTLTKARTAFFVERMYSDAYFQCLHRNRRIGTTESPVIVNLRSVTQTGKKTIDHTIHSVLDYRNNMIKAVTGRMLKEAFSE